MIKKIEKYLENILWWCRTVILIPVIVSLLAALIIIFIATVDVATILDHSFHYLSSTVAQREQIHSEVITHVIGAIDTYLMATVLIIFSFGLYELFISEIDPAKDQKHASKILIIHSLDDLKGRLAKLIVMIIIVAMFEGALRLNISGYIDLIYLGCALGLIAISLFLTHKSDAPH